MAISITIPELELAINSNSGAEFIPALALGAERDIEVTISNNTLEQKGAKITFHIYND